jgi:hypothetical protein
MIRVTPITFPAKRLCYSPPQIMKKFLAVAVLVVACVAAHAGTWGILDYDEDSQSLTLQHDGVTYITGCFEHVEPTPMADDDSRGVRAGWHAEWSTKDSFPCLVLAALVGKSLPDYTTPAAMERDSYAVEIAPAGIFIQHKLWEIPKHDPTAPSAYDSGGRDHEWWQLIVRHATVK